MKLQFEVKEINDESFWDRVEDRILDELKRYAQRSENGKAVRRRLFVEDAARGFAFIDLCRKHYDLVLMNPPFGGFSKLWFAQAKINYPNSSNDILAAFVERFLQILIPGGQLGAITSRTCLFLSSFKKWRLNIVLKQSAIHCIADLGQGVMDNAMVEAAAYVLAKARPTSRVTVFRAIADTDRTSTLKTCIDAHNVARAEDRLFLSDQATFHLLPDSPFVYWIEGKTIKQFHTGKTFEPDVGRVRVGLQTGDDPRFVRAVWEAPYQNTIFCYYPANGNSYCSFDDPIVRGYLNWRNNGVPHWAFHVKSGASQPWYSPITLKTNWAQDGNELKNFKNEKGKLRSRPQNTSFYYHPGFSWTRRAVRFYPYVIPGNCIPSVSRYMAFPKEDSHSEAIAVCASKLVSSFLRFYGEKFEFPNFLVDTMKMLPWPIFSSESKAHFQSLVFREVKQRRLAYQNHEPFHEFLLPVKIRDFSNAGQSIFFDPGALIDDATENLVAKAFGFSEEQVHNIQRDLNDAIAYRRNVGTATEEEGIDSEPEGAAEEDSEEDDSEFVLDYSSSAIEETHISYIVGCVFGRWDIRMALDPSLAPKLPEPFDPLPVCPPGMLIGIEGLPAESNNIAGEDWLRARLDANSPPPSSSMNYATIRNDKYPLSIAWSGVLVDDPGYKDEQLHDDDIVLRTRNAIETIWKERGQKIVQEACDALKCEDLRHYFRKSFFADHLKRYSKSHRKAPIYWQLSTPSASYSVWLYYHRFTEDTFYQVLNDYVALKLQFEERELNKIRQEYGPDPTAGQRKELAGREAFVAELATFKEEVARIAPLWNPNLNDGVIINFAPLWRLVPQNKPWQKECKQVWDKLVNGDYDWAHLAMHLWPERVVEKCISDRSLAITHGLDGTLWEADEKGKWHPEKIDEATLTGLIQARTSPTVQSALDDLLKAPAPSGLSGRKRKKKV